jgi:hypothetical protein
MTLKNEKEVAKLVIIVRRGVEDEMLIYPYMGGSKRHMIDAFSTTLMENEDLRNTVLAALNLCFEKFKQKDFAEGVEVGEVGRINLDTDSVSASLGAKYTAKETKK